MEPTNKQEPKGIDDAIKAGIKPDFENLIDLDGTNDPIIKKAKSKEASGLPGRIVKEIEHTHRFLVANESFYLLIRNEFGGGYYRQVDDRAIYALIERYAGKQYSSKIKREVEDMLKNHAYTAFENLNSDKENLNLLNGVFSIKFRKLREFHQDDKFTTIIPVMYDPEAKCPVWERVLEDIFPGNKNGNIVLLQQIAGYCLQTLKNHEKFFIFYGSGANGKSVVASVFEFILGFENCCNLNLDRLSNPRYWHLLVGKLLNISTESDTRVKNWSDVIKNAASGEPLLADPKHKQQFKFVPFAKHIFAMNELPYLEDKSMGVSRRMVILPFERMFTEEEQDISLKQKLQNEASGILNWFLKGLDMYLKDGFTIPDANLQLAQDVKTESNSVLMFFKENYMISFSDQDWVKCSDFYEEYKEWCIANNHKFYSSNRVGRILRNDLDVKVDKVSFNGLRFKAYLQLVKG